MSGHNADGYKDAMDSGSYVGAPYNFVPFSEKYLYEYDRNRRPRHNEITRNLQGKSAGDAGDDGEDELYTGEVEYTMTAQTPILIDGGKKDKDGKALGEFNKLPYFNKEKGEYEMRYAIPGSTARGLIRNNVQILGFCGFADDIDDYALMYRAVANGAEHDQYMKKVLGLQETGELRNVKAGYIKNVGGGQFQLIPVKKSSSPGVGTYFILKEKEIGANYDDYKKRTKKTGQERFEYDFFIQQNSRGEYLTQYKMPVSYEVKLVEGKNGKKKEKIVYKAEPNKSYLPYAWPVSYQLDQKKENVIKVYKRDELLKWGWHKGYVVSSGAMYGDQKDDKGKDKENSQNGKQVVYILPEPEPDDKKRFVISQKNISNFRADLEKRKNSLRGNLPSNYEEIENRWNRDNVVKPGRDKWQGMSYFDLPQEGDAPKPFFYIEEDIDQKKGTILLKNFGFTPHLRVPYHHTAKAGLPQDQREAEEKGVLDYAQAMFGTIDKRELDGNVVQNAFKSRVSFSDLFLKEGMNVTITEDARILAEPKPTSYLDYVEKEQTYNADCFQLRGVKQYWLHESLTDAGCKSSATEGQQNNEAVWSVMKPLSPQVVDGIKVKPVFRGKIRFKNLTKDELGLLLWCIRLEENSQMNIGKGKAYGFGRVKADILNVRRVVPEQAYNPDLLLREIETQGTGAGDSVRDIDGTLFQEPFEDLNEDDLIEYYKEYMGRKLAEQQTQKNQDNRKNKSRKVDIMKEPQIQSFLRMKDVTQMPSEDQMRYMDINKGEYQRRTSKLITLPTANEVPPAGEGNT